MKTYISDIIPKIQKFSQKLDNLTLLTDHHWVVIDDDIKSYKNVYIFRKNNELLISQNGKVEKTKWEYLGHNSLLIDRKEDSYLFRHGFFDESILALKVDSKNEYAFLVNESKFDKELNSLERIVEFLTKKYSGPQVKNHKQGSIIYNDTPNYKIVNKSDEIPPFGGIIELFNIEFDDGEIGELFFKKRKNQAFFKAKIDLTWASQKHYYDSFDSGINALHYFLITGKKLNIGFIATYG